MLFSRIKSDSIILPQRRRAVEAIHFTFTPSTDSNNFSVACEDKSLTPEPHIGFTRQQLSKIPPLGDRPRQHNTVGSTPDHSKKN